MELKKCRTCVGCYAYNHNSSGYGGFCILGFDTTDLISAAVKGVKQEEKHHVGRTTTGEYWTFKCKPAEPCLKPMTTRSYVEAFKLRHDITA